MSAWTWTFVKATALPKDEVKDFCEKEISQLNDIWYYKQRNNFEEVLDRWIEILGKSRGYYAEMYNLPIERITDKFLEGVLKERINTVNNLIENLKSVKNGEELNECLKKYTHSLMSISITCRLVDDDVWIQVREIFRLQEYSEMDIADGIKTIDELITYLKEPSRQKWLSWFDEERNDYNVMSEKKKKRIREYYGKYGDGNFSVSFG